MMPPDRTERAYFLGDLSPEEMTRLEISVMEDEAFAERTTSAEAELIDDYLEGSLTPAERQRFETVYMAVPERAGRVRLSRELAERASAEPSRAPGRRAGALPTWRLLLPMAAVLMVAAGVWMARGRSEESRVATILPGAAQTETPTLASLTAVTPSEVPSETPSETTITPAPIKRNHASFVLALGMARGTTTTPFVIPKHANVIDFEIDLEGESRFAAFDARVIDASGREIWRSSREAPLRPTAAGTLVVTVPITSGIGRSGRCELELNGRAGAGRPIQLARIPILFANP